MIYERDVKEERIIIIVLQDMYDPNASVSAYSYIPKLVDEIRYCVNQDKRDEMF